MNLLWNWVKFKRPKDIKEMMFCKNKKSKKKVIFNRDKNLLGKKKENRVNRPK